MKFLRPFIKFFWYLIVPFFRKLTITWNDFSFTVLYDGKIVYQHKFII